MYSITTIPVFRLARKAIQTDNAWGGGGKMGGGVGLAIIKSKVSVANLTLSYFIVPDQQLKT
jgi:hypothetical protein